jgi:hypothetical protein
VHLDFAACFDSFAICFEVTAMFTHLLIAALSLGQVADDPVSFINRELALNYQSQKLTPSEKTSDQEFLRRSSLDLIGRIPTIAEQSAYMMDSPAKRRALLVNRLLDHDDFARHWANVWTDWLLGSAGDDTGRQAFHGWLQTHFARNGSHKEMVEMLLLAKGTTSDNPALQFYVTHRGQLLPEKEWEKYGQHDMIPLTGKVFRVLHATRMQCVECHDHPFYGDLRQGDFHQMKALFLQVEFTSKKETKATEMLGDNPAFNGNALIFWERLNSTQLGAQPSFYSEVWNRKLKQTRREFFTERFIKHPDFARAHVNFIWAQIFGHGLTQTADHDDMGEHNPVKHPKILDRLAADFVKSGHDPKALLRWICNTDAYGLKSIANKTIAGPDHAMYFARMQARPLSREQLAESVLVALTTDNYVKRRDDLRAKLLKEFKLLPPTPRHLHCDIEPLNPEGNLSIRRALWMMNSATLNRELAADDGTVAKALEKAGGASLKGISNAVPDLYAIALCRPILASERVRLASPQLFSFRPRSEKTGSAAKFWSDYGEDILWSLLNSNEFALNH